MRTSATSHLLFFLVGTLCIAFTGVLSSVPIATAHSSGFSLTATSSPYVVDIGYDPSEFQVGLNVRFDFQLLDEQTARLQTYDHVWFRLQRNHDASRNTVLATGVRHQDSGPTTLLYTFFEAGGYSIEVSFRDVNGDNIATATFPLTILEKPSVPWQVLFSGVALLAGVALGVLGVYFVGRKRI